MSAGGVVFQEVVINDDDAVMMMLQFLSDNQVRLAEVYVETEALGESHSHQYSYDDGFAGGYEWGGSSSNYQGGGYTGGYGEGGGSINYGGSSSAGWFHLLLDVRYQPRDRHLPRIQRWMPPSLIWCGGRHVEAQTITDERPPTSSGFGRGTNDGISRYRKPGEDRHVFEGDRHFPLRKVECMGYGTPSFRHCRKQLVVDLDPQEMAQHSQTGPRYIGLQPWMSSGQVIGPFMNHGNKRFLKKIGKTSIN
ncbi:unnamed protein product [Linum trigynum]|uniref:Uncharacterized protein n=1 Tax=Linum trigynum TaxID=586398 RepID=A0AAV2D7D9_9ROSI